MKLAGFDMNLLVALDALLTQESVSRAAEQLRVGQPAMSATLARLRSTFGDPLLVKSGRGLKRTALADSLREPLAEILRGVQALVESTDVFDAAVAHRTFTVVASDYVSLVLIRPLIERVGKIAPHVTVSVEPVSAEQLDQLRRGQIDLVIYPAELLPLNAPFDMEVLFEDEFICVVDQDNDLVGSAIDLETFTELPYLASGHGVLASVADTRLEGAGISLNTTMSTQAFMVAPFLIRGTRMFTITQRRLAILLGSSAGVRIAEPPIPIATIHENMVWTRRRGADAAHAWLREQLRITASSI